MPEFPVSAFRRLCLVCVALALVASAADHVWAQQEIDAQWIWFDSGNPAQEAPAGKVWFRREVKADEPSTGAAVVACDDAFVLWVNGRKIGEGTGDKSYRFSLSGIVERGTNVFAVEAANKGGRAGLLVEAEIRGQSGRAISCDSGPQWLATTSDPKSEAWLKPGFAAADWRAVRVLGLTADTPWKHIEFPVGELDRFQVADGFEVKQIAGHELAGSLVAMTWGNRGRLIGSRERGPIVSLIDDDNDGDYDSVIEYCDTVTNCQGLCMVFDDLYAVGTGPQGTGLYRLRDNDHDDRADEVLLVTSPKGHMGEHGPHDVVFGPDGWLYHNLGNHAWIVDTPQQNSPCRGWEEGYLLEPAFEDANGHAVGIEAPGGTIWRFSPDGERWWAETVGFRNHYDFAFNRRGDMFTFDSDMEWDVNLPWYKTVRINHCIPGAEFGWRSGAKNWPEWYFDALPGTVDIGRGSPTGVVFYEHTQFPEKYRGALLNCDWSMGRIIVAYLDREGATYRGTSENLVTGNPLNVSDIEVDRDGTVVFCTGGRNTQGGVYRVSYRGAMAAAPAGKTFKEVLHLPQPQAGWNRELVASVKETLGEQWQPRLLDTIRHGTGSEKIRALTLLSQHGPKPEASVLYEAAADADPEVRQFALLLLGDHPSPETAAVLAQTLTDDAPAVQRRACEAFVRSGLEAPAEPLVRLLGSHDRWLRFAARLALERIPPAKWKAMALADSNPHVQLNALLALYRLGPSALSPDEAVTALKGLAFRSPLGPADVDFCRMLELLLVRTNRESREFRVLQGLFGERMLRTFAHETTVPGEGGRASPLARETGELIAWLDVPGAAASLMHTIEAAAGDAPTQTHYALCLRYIRSGWTPAVTASLLTWFESTRSWEGGNSLQGYLRNIIVGCLERLTPQERREFILKWRENPHAAQVVLAASQPEEIFEFGTMVGRLIADLQQPSQGGGQALLGMAIDALGRSSAPESQQLLREMFEKDADRRDLLARALAKQPRAENAPMLLRAVATCDPTTVQVCLQSLAKIKYKPEKPDEFRIVIVAGLKLGQNGGKAALNLLRKWCDSAPPEGENVVSTLGHYQSWFVEKFPEAAPPAVADADAEKVGYTVQQLVDFLDAPEGGRGDVDRGRQVFVKASCAKCHKFLQDGEGVGPDLTTLRRRFQKKEIVESILLPSQVVSDQFAAFTIVTKDGLVHTGMPVPGSQKKMATLLLSDGTRLDIPRNSIEGHTRAQVSVMPEGLLKPLSLSEIADLFAFLETSKNNTDPTATAAAAPSAKQDQ